MRQEEETEEEKEEEEGKEAGARAPLALSHTNAARDYPPAHAALRAFPLLAAPPHCSFRTPGFLGAKFGA